MRLSQNFAPEFTLEVFNETRNKALQGEKPYNVGFLITLYRYLGIGENIYTITGCHSSRPKLCSEWNGNLKICIISPRKELFTLLSFFNVHEQVRVVTGRGWEENVVRKALLKLLFPLRAWRKH
ncbi:hypothetical protein CEXT_461221 [Caerostris extrusa]|uniref:Uncharacterized protein n=1 Tax=Caerostris extrusa TaxID=172846 RepID=A0AAV4RZQ9_CAEEX|nr:hypothetical protein CEXT_461221 [Caerostris extrusa]